MADIGNLRGLAIDPSNMQSLKRLSRDRSPEATRAAAQQFEALFLNIVVKNMRSANAQHGVQASDQERMFQSMLDQQFAQNIVARGSLGLAKTIEQQLSRTAPPAVAPPDVPSLPKP